MDGLLAKLTANNVVLDLGCGRGSFHYEAYAFRTIATDLHLPDDLVDPMSSTFNPIPAPFL